MLVGVGGTDRGLREHEVHALLVDAFEREPLDGKRVLVIIPDGTRSAPVPLLFELLYEVVGRRVKRLDYLVALGTHPPMSPAALDQLVGVPAAERATRYPNVAVFNHEWDRLEALITIGTISRQEADALSGGLLAAEVPVTLNRSVLDYDRLIICGPVFPHEVAGFSGGAKYLFPGIAGPDIINFTHWLGALVTSMDTIGIKDTPVRRVIHRAADFVPGETTCAALVMHGDILHGMYIGPHAEAFSAAADLSALLNIVYKPRPFQRVLSMPSRRYDDLWTAAKAMYKTEPVVADGGEVIIYAPHLAEVSFTHGALIERIGYHVRDYFLAQWDRFRDVPGGILAHSTHVKGAGTYDAASGVETPRIQVTLATGIPETQCRRINLGYRDYRELAPAQWEGREREGMLLVPHAGEMLFRLAEVGAERSAGHPSPE